MLVPQRYNRHSPVRNGGRDFVSMAAIRKTNTGDYRFTKPFEVRKSQMRSIQL